ncbi:MAG: SEC-C metal-binding domain-containing protein, partial [Gammaproteobacteria bacterium]
WLSELWESHLPQELADAHEDDLACLGFFADAPAIHADIAARARKARRDPDAAFLREAETARADFAAALASFAARGRLIRDYVIAREAQRTPVRSSKTGRNAPCPCGSGRKYKKCCGVATA